MTIKPFENPKPSEAVIEIRLFLGDEQTRVGLCHLKNLPDGRAERAEAFAEHIPPLLDKLMVQYLKGDIAK